VTGNRSNARLDGATVRGEGSRVRSCLAPRGLAAGPRTPHAVHTLPDAYGPLHASRPSGHRPTGPACRTVVSVGSDSRESFHMLADVPARAPAPPAPRQRSLLVSSSRSMREDWARVWSHPWGLQAIRGGEPARQAEGVGFEPSGPGLRAQRFSRPPHTTLSGPSRLARRWPWGTLWGTRRASRRGGASLTPPPLTRGTTDPGRTASSDPRARQPP
jgi:hypothetical protein